MLQMIQYSENILNDDILVDILLITTDLRTIMNLRQTCKLYQMSLNSTNILRELSKNIKSNIIKVDNNIPLIGNVRFIKYIKTYKDFVEWYINNFYVKDTLNDPYLLKLIIIRIIANTYYDHEKTKQLAQDLNINSFDDI